MKNIFWMLLLISLNSLADKRSRSIDFDDTLVEGMNKKPLDSLSTVADDFAHLRPRLYRKRGGFRDQIPQTLEELRSQP